MKKIIMKILLTGAVISSGFGYEASKVEVGFTGYKLQNKVPVSGTFATTKLKIENNDDFSKFLTSANVSIDVNSIDTKLKMRNENIKSTLFKIAGITEINAKIIKVTGNDAKGTVNVEINMNDTKKIIPMTFIVTNNVLSAKGEIDVLDFAMNKSFNAFAAKCKPFHANKTWSNVGISFNMPFKK